MKLDQKQNTPVYLSAVPYGQAPKTSAALFCPSFHICIVIRSQSDKLNLEIFSDATIGDIKSSGPAMHRRVCWLGVEGKTHGSFEIVAGLLLFPFADFNWLRECSL